MATNKKTTEPIFSDQWAAAEWVTRNCVRCAKYTEFNPKTGGYPSRRCAVQRDIDLQQTGEGMEVSQRSYEACQNKECPFFKSTGDVFIGAHVTTKSIPTAPLLNQSERKVINILAEAEKSVRKREEEVERQAKEAVEAKEREERNKVLDHALAKAYDRRMNRDHVAKPTTLLNNRKRQVTPELQAMFKEKGMKMKMELDDIVRLHLSSLHIIMQCTLDIGDGIMQDCIREIKARGLYKHQLKKQINAALEAYRKVVGKLSFVTKEVAELRNMLLDNIYDEVQNDVTMLTLAMHSVLERNNVKNSMLIAKVDAAWALFEIARQEGNIIYDATIAMVQNVFRREKIQIPGNFKEELDAYFFGKRADGIAKEWQKVSLMLQPQIDGVPEQMTNDTNVKNCITIIQRKVSNIQKLEDMSNALIEENPALLDNYKKNRPDWDRTLLVS